MGKANWFFNTKERRWELRDTVGNMIMTGNNAGIAAPRVTVGSLAIDRALVVETTGTIQNLNVGTLAIIRSLAVAGVGSLRDLNVGTLAILRSLAVAGVGSIAQGRLENVRIAGGATWSIFTSVSGTIPAITAVGTGAIAVATLTGVASAGLNVGDIVIGRMDAAGMGGHTGLVGMYIPTTNVVNMLIANTKPDSAGSFVSVGWSGIQVRF